MSLPYNRLVQTNDNAFVFTQLVYLETTNVIVKYCILRHSILLFFLGCLICGLTPGFFFEGVGYNFHKTVNHSLYQQPNGLLFCVKLPVSAPSTIPHLSLIHLPGLSSEDVIKNAKE